MLYLLIEAGNELYAVVNKPRTVLDAKRISVDLFKFPRGSIEADVLHALNNARNINPKRLISVKQLTSKRGWWSDAYLYALNQLPDNLNDYIVYTNTPFSWKLAKVLKERGAAVLFDAMDNMMTYPHFWEKEKEAAKEGYGKFLAFSDYSCANSQRTVDCFKAVFGYQIDLVKNGVFQPRIVDSSKVEQISYINSVKSSFRCGVGFIGKFGLRMDHRFIGELAERNPDCLFVFIGLELTGQCENFNKVVLEHSNILKLPPIPSAYVYAALKEFDALMIPYSVGDNENSGDPLKLYQYFMTNKPILCTPIAEVDCYKGYICISSDVDEWTSELKLYNKSKDYSRIKEEIQWTARTSELMSRISCRMTNTTIQKQNALCEAGK